MILKNEKFLSDEELIKIFDSLEWDKQVKGKHFHEFAYLTDLQKHSLMMYWIVPTNTNFKLGGKKYIIDSFRVDRYDPTKIVEENKVLKHFRKTRTL